jgi:hypothetical protein
MAIDANGYCTQCHTYRGLPQNDPYGNAPYSSPPQSGVPYSGAPYGQPQSGTPYGAQPQSGGPAYGGYPASGAPMYQQPTSGGAYQSTPSTTYGGNYGAPTTPPKKRSSFIVPLLALSGVLAILVVAIVVVVLVRKGGDNKTDNAGNNTTAHPSAAASASPGLVDDCVVGTWSMTSYSENVPVPNVGTVPFKLQGKGAVMTFGADGKGKQDYGSGTNFAGDATVSGTTVTINLKVEGDITYDFRTSGGTMTFSDLVSNANATVSAAGQEETDKFDGSDDASKYTCQADRMTMTTSDYTMQLSKTGS